MPAVPTSDANLRRNGTPPFGPPGEMALDVVDQLVRSNAVDMVVVDSVAALVPRAELEGEMADMQMGLQARLMSKVC